MHGRCIEKIFLEHVYILKIFLYPLRSQKKIFIDILMSWFSTVTKTIAYCKYHKVLVMLNLFRYFKDARKCYIFIKIYKYNQIYSPLCSDKKKYNEKFISGDVINCETSKVGCHFGRLSSFTYIQGANKIHVSGKFFAVKLEMKMQQFLS